MTSRTEPSPGRLRPWRTGWGQTRNSFQVLSKASAQVFQYCRQEASQKGLSHSQAHGIRHIGRQAHSQETKQPWNAGELMLTGAAVIHAATSYMCFIEEAACTGGVMRRYLSALTLSMIIWIFFPFGPRERAATQRVSQSEVTGLAFG